MREIGPLRGAVGVVAREVMRKTWAYLIGVKLDIICRPSLLWATIQTGREEALSVAILEELARRVRVILAQGGSRPLTEVAC